MISADDFCRIVLAEGRDLVDRRAYGQIIDMSNGAYVHVRGLVRRGGRTGFSCEYHLANERGCLETVPHSEIAPLGLCPREGTRGSLENLFTFMSGVAQELNVVPHRLAEEHRFMVTDYSAVRRFMPHRPQGASAAPSRGQIVAAVPRR